MHHTERLPQALAIACGVTPVTPEDAVTLWGVDMGSPDSADAFATLPMPPQSLAEFREEWQQATAETLRIPASILVDSAPTTTTLQRHDYPPGAPGRLPSPLKVAEALDTPQARARYAIDNPDVLHTPGEYRALLGELMASKEIEVAVKLDANDIQPTIDKAMTEIGDIGRVYRAAEALHAARD